MGHQKSSKHGANGVGDALFILVLTQKFALSVIGKLVALFRVKWRRSKKKGEIVKRIKKLTTSSIDLSSTATRNSCSEPTSQTLLGTSFGRSTFTRDE